MSTALSSGAHLPPANTQVIQSTNQKFKSSLIGVRTENDSDMICFWYCYVLIRSYLRRSRRRHRSHRGYHRSPDRHGRLDGCCDPFAGGTPAATAGE